MVSINPTVSVPHIFWFKPLPKWKFMTPPLVTNGRPHLFRNLPLYLPGFYTGTSWYCSATVIWLTEVWHRFLLTDSALSLRQESCNIFIGRLCKVPPQRLWWRHLNLDICSSSSSSRGATVWTTCPRLLRQQCTNGIEPATFCSLVQRSACSVTLAQ